MEAFLMAQELWDVVNGSYAFPLFADKDNPTEDKSKKRKDWIDASNKALGNIIFRCSPAIQDKIQGGSADTAWLTLQCNYDKKLEERPRSAV